MILYRVSPFKQNNPPPIYADDKWELVKYAHESFLKANDSDEKVTYLLDRCEGWTDYFQKTGVVINYTGKDRSYSILKMFEMAKEAQGKVLMVEDDYYWRPNTIKILLRGLDEFKLVSPYDHPAHYIEEQFKDFQFKLKLIDNTVWRNAPSNTHTFGTTGDYMREHWDVFREGMWDAPMFRELPDQVFNPIPGLATHLCRDWISPGFENLFK
jgi:hypothetical protein